MLYDSYQSPLVSRYASKEMVHLFSQNYRITTWRRLWIALATAEQKLGLEISNAQITELENNITPIDFVKAQEYENELRHDVMAHILTWGDQCPKARSIIHLGATSCYVTDNGDVIQMRDALKLLEIKLVQLIRQFQKFAEQYATMPCLAYTHYQPAQPTTVGKRSCLWLQDFLMDLQELALKIKDLRLLGIKGATGTQASFLLLFDGDHNKVKELDKLVAQEVGFDKIFNITGQTYPRKQDATIMNLLVGIATSANKFATDLRLLANHQEIEEPFENKQVGSSAMPYKRNPMRAERICALARFISTIADNAKYTAANQWLERTLDDSANRRLAIAEAFLATDSILNLMINVTNGLVVYPKVIANKLKMALPFLATENILMACVEKGYDRQEIHEILRQHSQASTHAIKMEGLPNDLIDRIINDPNIPLSKEEIETLIDVTKFIGRAPQQTNEFLQEEVSPFLKQYGHIKNVNININV